MDEQIPFMNRLIWADEINDAWARTLKARYYGEITYIDDCLGRVLDAVERREDSDNTIICFFSDHGDHMGDHTAWQKESFFDVSARVPFLVSWPAHLDQDIRREDLVCLTDLFGIATHAAGETQTRDGVDVLGIVDGMPGAREHLFGYYGEPGTDQFKIMARDNVWKYIYISNGNREQLFNLIDDPAELVNRSESESRITANLRKVAIEACRQPGAEAALDGEHFKSFEYTQWDAGRIYQFDLSRGVRGFPNKPEDVLKDWSAK